MAQIAGNLARSTGINVQSFGVQATTSITIGATIELDASGQAKTATTSGTRSLGLAVALETVDNSSGSAGDLYIRCAVGNTWVYATAGGALKVGSAVKAIGTAGKLQADASAPSVATVGVYYGHEGEEATPTDAVDTDIIVVRLGL